MNKSNRLYSLDYLRGLSAFGIMIYHYLSQIGLFSGDSIMGRVGIYGVSIFYVLSGLTMYHVYQKKMEPNFQEIIDFTRKRILRIFPLLWLATIVSIILSKQIPEFSKLVLNLTGLYGFVDWSSYYATGAWSIGNELVFYVFFPFLMLFYKNSKIVFYLFSLAISFLFLYFTFYVFDGNIALSSQWKDYVNPFNQVIFFLSGFLIGAWFKEREIKTPVTLVLLVSSALLFIYYPTPEATISIVTGINRIVFTIGTVVLCLSFYKLKLKLPSFIHRPLALLGEASYSVYLLHMLVMYSVSFMNKHLFNFSYLYVMFIAVAATLVISYFVYEYFEKYFMKFSRKPLPLFPAFQTTSRKP